MDEKKLLKRAEAEMRDAYDFDPRDPLFGLSKDDLRGNKISRRATLRLLAAGGALSLAQVLPGLRPAPALAQGQSGGVLNAAWADVAEITTLDPAQIGQVLQFQITSNVLSGLMHINNELVAEGDLAESWEVSDDGLIYTIKLREGVTFHNGDPFTSEDVLFTYNRSSDPEQSRHSSVIANVASLEALNDLEVRFTLKAPQASFLTKALERASGRAMTIVSRGALEEMGLAQYGLTPVGTGPFRITEHELGGRVVLEKFENYFDPERPKLDGVIIQPIVGTEPLAAAIEAGDVDYIGGNPLPGELVDRFRNNSELAVDIKPGPGFQSIWMNPWIEPMQVTDFDKPLEELKQENGFKVRLALAKALDRDLFVQQALFGNGLPAYGSINAAMSFYYNDSLAETSEQAFDPEGAQALMAEAGFPGGEGFPTLRLQTTPGTRRAGLVVANIYKQVLGIDVQVDPKEFSVGIEEFNNMDFDLRLGGSGGDYDPDDGLIDWMMTSSKFNGPFRDTAEMPFGFFSEAEVDALSQQQSVTADPEQRRALVQQANKITSDKVCCGFLYHPVDILVHSTRVNVPPESRIPGLHDFDRMTLS
jgi:ABC-type transport system substrate-binding protein